MEYIELNSKNFYKLAMTREQFFVWMLAGNNAYTYSSLEVELGGAVVVAPRTITSEEVGRNLRNMLTVDKNKCLYGYLGQYFITTKCADGTNRLMWVGRSPEHLKALTWFNAMLKASYHKDTAKIVRLKESFMEIQECLAKEGFTYVRKEE